MTGGTDVFRGGGEMGALARTVDWGATPIGPVEAWPQSLRTAAGICLASRFPQLIWWGPELIQIYNDGYRPVLGAKHPRAMGQRGDECWAEIWDVVGPMYEQVRTTGRSTWAEDLLLVMERYGFTEETYFTFSYSAIRDESGEVAGVLVTCVETTGRVLGERRLDTLRALSAQAADARSGVDAAAAAALQTLAANPDDVPFALLYLLDDDGVSARLAGAAGLDPGAAAAPPVIALDADDPASPWPLARVVATGETETVEGLGQRLALPRGPWPRVAERALVLPVARPGQSRPAGVLVAGVSRALALDGAYRGFFELLATHLGAVLANAAAWEEERDRIEALAELDRAKTSFFNNVSHEFRTPITLLLAPLEDALENADGVVSRDALERMHRNALRLLRLVNTLLDFSRIEAGRVTASFEPTDLAALTRDLASSFRSAIERASLSLELDLAPLPGPVHVDRDMWEKIVLNLISNAFKHTFEGSIRVSLQTVDDAVELTVQDTGVGIAEDERSNVFDRFHRVRGARSRTHEGSGIGLALVRELVRLHGGEIHVRSRVGVGTAMVVRVPFGTAHLPADQVHAAPVQARPASEAAAPFVEEALRWLPEAPGDVAGGTASPPGVPSRLLTSTSDARVLIADDNADLRDYVARLLAPHWSVETVADGLAALESARRSPPDLLLADVMMPRLDGIELVAALRADETLREIPVVLLSARAGEEARVEGLGAGADDYLVKPFSARELVARVGAALALARVRREAAVERDRLFARIAAERERLAELFEQAPAIIAVLSGPAHVFEMANRRYIEFIGGRDVVGLPVRDALPELADQPYFELLDRVYATGRPYVGEEQRLVIRRASGSPRDTLFINFVYHPLRDSAGRVDGIFVHGVDVTELVLAREAAEEASRAKSDFMATVSHELRTPMNAILGYVDLLRLGIPITVPAPASRHVERIAASARHLHQLIDELLTFARIQGDREQINIERVRIDELLDEIRAVIEPLADAKGLAFRIVVTDAPAELRTDPGKLRQILLNLLGNAVKFTREGEVVLALGSHDDGGLRLSVRDTGPGIPAADRDRVFEPFWQGRRASSGSAAGTGLGLAISGRLAGLLGGSVELRSEEGAGSEFTLLLPEEPPAVE